MYYVYILASGRAGTLYVGMTNDIRRRVWEHREGVVDGFTKVHGVKRLVHVEVFETALQAIQREKALKRWRRDWKCNLIERENPEWSDLFDALGPS